MGNRKLFKIKLELEYKVFCRKLLAKEEDVMLENVEKIYWMKRLMWEVLEQSAGWTEEEIEVLLVFPGFLGYLCRKWSRTESALSTELGRCVRKESARVVSAYREIAEAA